MTRILLTEGSGAKPRTVQTDLDGQPLNDYLYAP
jgi:hypothetical protein